MKPIQTAASVLLASFVFHHSASASAPKSDGTVTLYVENDTFAGTDRDYTSGVKLSWSSADLQNLSDSPYASPFLPLFNVLPYINERDYQKNLVLSLGQNIYTPENTEAYGLIKDDRPYAGWLYLGLGVVWKDAQVRNALSLDIGMVGPASLAEESQDLIHDLIDEDSPNGWDNQLDNELAFVVSYERTWRWPAHERRSGLDWELLPHAGLDLGTVRTAANAGWEFRFGLNLPDDFGTAPISSGGSTSTPVDGQQGASRSRFDIGAYLFTRVDGSAVAHNIFLDGNTFSNSHSVDREVFVADLSAGIAFNYRNTKLAYAMVYRTEEFKEQDEPQVFGTVSLNWTY
ncbi:MAG: lipid A deacylase LpxR family protein [Verrucomicrobiaceae bacterium]|nr:MAG: lipid A deacylase LpxR family protein [Verrucomicrobiaceae bacterium]